MTLFGNKVTADVTSSDEVILEQDGWCPKKQTQTQRWGGGTLCHVMTEAETEALQLEAKEQGCQQPPAARNRQGRLLPYTLQGEHRPANTLISNLEPPEL